MCCGEMCEEIIRYNGRKVIVMVIEIAGSKQLCVVLMIFFFDKISIAFIVLNVFCVMFE